jgi:hypothetical protein
VPQPTPGSLLQRNYRTFLLFIFTTSILCIYVFACCLTQLFLKHNQLVDDARRDGRITSGLWGKTLADVPAALALMAYTFLFFLFVGGLTGFHSYLVATNQTTYENFRYNNSDMPNPYDIGLFSNCAQVSPGDCQLAVDLAVGILQPSITLCATHRCCACASLQAGSTSAPMRTSCLPGSLRRTCR